MVDPTKPRKVKSGDTVSRLQRGILRLALSFHGQNPELDARLKELGILVRGGTKDESLQTLVDDIVEIIINQDMRQNTDQRGGRALSDLLGRIQARIPHSQSLGPIIDNLALPVSTDSLDDALDEAAIAVSQLAGRPAPSQSAADSITDFFCQIDFSNSTQTDFAELAERIRNRKNDIQLVKDLDEAARIISAEIADGGGVDRILETRDQLLLLMNLIPFPSTLTDRFSQTRRSIEDANTATEINRCIPEIANLTAAMRMQLQQEIEELGAFLKNTLTRLQEFEEQINNSSRFHEQSQQNSIDLEQTLSDQSARMRAELDDDDDIDSIKLAVKTHLDGVSKSLNQFVEVEGQRNENARERIDEMVGALSELEFEAKELRASLEKQHEQVLIDPLTGILNRSGYAESVNKEFVRWKRYETALSLAVIDLDLFKNINDSYGHSVGDKVLANVARQIESKIRECDILCRYGGEEFVLLLPETEMNASLALLEKLRISLEACNFHFQDQPVPVTMSCGVASFRKGDSIEDVFDRADQAMYLAKRSGRNQCCSEEHLNQATA